MKPRSTENPVARTPKTPAARSPSAKKPSGRQYVWPGLDRGSPRDQRVVSSFGAERDHAEG
jgi:hypothetical protein